MENKSQFLLRLSLIASLLALFVIVLGAYTRLTHAGLGCPDWPGCYGHALAPTSVSQIDMAKSPFPLELVTPDKAWTEMVHRYFAFTLALLTIVIAAAATLRAIQGKQGFWIPLFLVACIIFQALLGKWTVTWKLLPTVVMGHLLGGLIVLSLLWTQSLIMKKPENDLRHWQAYRPWALLGLILVFIQILLGGWVSSNYAAIICPNFPICEGSMIPTMDFKHAFNFLVPIGDNYYGGNLNHVARVTIQMTHRYGAFIVAAYSIIFGFSLLLARAKPIRQFGVILLSLVSIQFLLGILNVLWVLPLPIAVAHNGFAALLLLVMVTMTYYTQKSANT